MARADWRDVCGGVWRDCVGVPTLGELAVTTRYRIVKDVIFEDGGRPRKRRHPDQPADGFESATAAAIWAETRNLDGSWYIQPVEGA